MKEFPPFYIGQKVVCLVDEPIVGIKKGDVFTVSACYKFCCAWLAETLEVVSPINFAGSCKHKTVLVIEKGARLPIECDVLSPVEENFQSIELEKVIEIETPLICVN